MGRWGGRDSPFKAKDGGPGSGIAGHSTGKRASFKNSFSGANATPASKEQRDTSLEGLKSEFAALEKESHSYRGGPPAGMVSKLQKLHGQIKAKEGK